MPSKGRVRAVGLGGVVGGEGVERGLVEGPGAGGQRLGHQGAHAVADHADHLRPGETRQALRGHQPVEGGVDIGGAVHQRAIEVEDRDV